jgi:hypothetical protein
VHVCVGAGKGLGDPSILVFVCQRAGLAVRFMLCVYLLRGVGHVLPNIVPGPGIVAITLVLMSLLVLDMYRLIKFVRVHDVARQVEEEAVEVQLWYLGRERCHAHPAAL